MNNLMLLAGSLVPTNTTQKLLTLIEQGSENDDTDQAIKLYAVKAYVHLLRTQELPDSLVQIGSWVGIWNFDLSLFCPIECPIDGGNRSMWKN